MTERIPRYIDRARFEALPSADRLRAYLLFIGRPTRLRVLQYVSQAACPIGVLLGDQRQGWVTRRSDGRYVLTAAGQREFERRFRGVVMERES
jgi:hypothetical protein